MSFTLDHSEDEEEVVRLSAAEVKKYEARFSQSVVRFSNLQINECIGKGICTLHILLYSGYGWYCSNLCNSISVGVIIFITALMQKCLQQWNTSSIYLESCVGIHTQVHLVKCLLAC